MVYSYEVCDAVTEKLGEIVKTSRPFLISLPKSKNISKQEFFDFEIPQKDRFTARGEIKMLHPHFTKYQNSLLKDCQKILGCVSTNASLMVSHSVLPWHTNSDNHGKRMYYTYTTGEAIFRYYYNGEYINSYDSVGAWTRREFEVPTKKQGLLWHEIWTEKPRFVFGFKPED